MNIQKIFFMLGACCFSSTIVAQCPPNTNSLLQGTAIVCAVNNAGKVYINDPAFDVQEWFYSHDNQNWMVTAGSDTLYYTGLTQTTYYKANVKYGACSVVLSNVITITVHPVSIAGTITGAVKGCRYTHSGVLTLENYRGSVVHWLAYDTLTNVWNTVDNTTDQYHFTNLATETYYKAVVKNGVCPADTSPAATVGVYLLPEVHFNDPSACLGTAMQFYEDVHKSYEADNILSLYQWNFDDGTTSTERFPIKTYTDARMYNVTLMATTSQNCSSSLTRPVTVYHNPIANFNTSNVCLGDSSRFRDASISNSGNIVQYYWTFGDMENDNIKNPIHKYADAQTYTVGLSVTSIYGCNNSTSQTVQVYQNPVAAFIADSVCLGDATHFTDYSISGDGLLHNFQWTFGDAAVSKLQHPSHLFAAAQNYTTQLLVETDKGCRDSVTHEIVVYPLPVVVFDVINACDGMPVQFVNHSTVDAGTIAAYQWNFGDGATSPDKNPEKLYFNAGIYTVELLAISDRNCETRLQQPATVYKNPVADFLVGNECLHTPITVVNKSFIRNDESLVYQWDLGNGDTRGNHEFQYVYQDAGNYAIKLIVTSDRGQCRDSMTNTVQIYALPDINAGADVTTSLGYAVQLQASGGKTYYWSPAGGLLSTHIANPIANPKQTTEYTVEGVDEYGCINYDVVTVFIIEDNKVVPTNLVTPDGNGKNDTWIISNIENYPQALVTVFDLHGKELFSARNYQNTWDGRNKNGDIVPDGTYYYVITFGMNDRIYKGAITILRNQ
jgi:gliding motility-associated-like protein